MNTPAAVPGQIELRRNELDSSFFRVGGNAFQTVREVPPMDRRNLPCSMHQFRARMRLRCAPNLEEARRFRAVGALRRIAGKDTEHCAGPSVCKMRNTARHS